VKPSVDALRQFLHYDPTTGRLFWRERAKHTFAVEHMAAAWNAQWAGKEAFTGATNQGYRYGEFQGKRYTAHRVIWAIVTGVWPDHDIDHKNLNKTDNKWSNLRKATHSQNRQNTTKTVRNRSGIKGVYFIPRMNKWAAKIGNNGRVQYLGSFDGIEDAAAAYAEASATMHGEYGRTSCA
jgi:hypothetical protein